MQVRPVFAAHASGNYCDHDTAALTRHLFIQVVLLDCNLWYNLNVTIGWSR